MTYKIMLINCPNHCLNMTSNHFSEDGKPTFSLFSLILDLQVFDAIWRSIDLFSRVKICNSLIFQVIYKKCLKLYLFKKQETYKKLEDRVI
jgi:hypothetical protein